MPYTPDPDDATAPLESVLAGTAAAEFRALKEKVNNVFLETGYDPVLKQQLIRSGLQLLLDIPASVATGIAYGIAINVTRNDTSAPSVSAVAAQLTAIQGNNCNDVNDYVFGAATEAWTSPVNSQAILVGLESSVISQYNDNSCALVGFDVVFKNRPDLYVGGVINATALVAGLSYAIVVVGTTDFTLIGAASNTVGLTFVATGVGTGNGTAQLSVRQGLGANHYNLNSRAIQITAQARSGAGEYAGWHKGITFEANAIDYALVSAVPTPGIAIDLAHMGNPANVSGYNNPWVAWKHSSALALSEYMSITFDQLQFTRMFLDSFNTRMWLFAIGGNFTSPTDVSKCVGFDYTDNMLLLPTTTDQGSPAAADCSFIVEIASGQQVLVHGTLVP